MEISEIEVKGFGYCRAGTNCPVGTIKIAILVVTFEKNDSMDNIDLFNTDIIDIVEEAVEEKMEMFPSCESDT